MLFRSCVLLIVSCLFTWCTGLKDAKGNELGSTEKSEGYAMDKEIVYDYEDVKDVVIRFHVLANSDTDEDQNLKLKVRDEILNYLKPYLEDLELREDAKNMILDKEDEIKDIALKVIEEKYPVSAWNIYPIYASDGDNWSEDNEKAINAVKKICEISNMFGYAELLPSTYTTTMYHKFKKEITNENFVPVVIKEKKDLWDALKTMLRKELKEAE